MQEINKFFNEGDRINLLLMNGYDNHQYVSKIESINSDETIDVLIPISKNRIIYIKNEAFLKVITAKEGAIYEFKAQVVNKLFGKIPLLRLSKVSEITKIQRRNYYRLKIINKIKVRKVINLKEKQFDEFFAGSLVDISGGGVAISTSKELELNDLIETNMDLNSQNICTFGTIVRKDLREDGSNSPFVYGVKFEKITEHDRNIIMRFIFEEQRKLAKKGLI